MSTNKLLDDNLADALNRLHVSRTGKPFAGVPSGGSEQETICWLKKRVFEEKIWPEASSLQVARTGVQEARLHLDAKNWKLNSEELAEAILMTAHTYFSYTELDKLRKYESARDEGAAYYNIETNEKLPYGEEDLFALIQAMDGRFVWDRNLDASEKLKMEKYASIIGQALDHEEDFWNRKRS